MNQLFTVVPPDTHKIVTASVGFVSPVNQPHLYAIVRNKRGWDIPGGHVEKDELPLDAFTREVLEETACELTQDATLIAILQSTKNPQTGIAVYKAGCEIKDFAATDEIYEVAFVTVDELLARYFGDKKLLEELLHLV